MANNVDPDQMPRTAASDICLHFNKRLSVSILRVITVITFISNKHSLNLRKS